MLPEKVNIQILCYSKKQENYHVSVELLMLISTGTSVSPV